MGTPDFAVPSLDILVKAGFSVKAVVTAPDRPSGRGLKLQPSAVKQYALEYNLSILQPENLKDPEFLEQLQLLSADLFVVVAFRILPEAVFAMPPQGTINLHASLLPDYRGAAPINRAIMNGEQETGVSTFFIEKQVDTGKIIFQEITAIGENETAGELHDKLMQIGARLVLDTVDAIAEGRVISTTQPRNPDPKTAPKIFPEDGHIRFDLDMIATHNLIRGLSPHPGAWLKWEGKRLKIYRTVKEPGPHSHKPRTVATDYQSYIRLAFPEGCLNVSELQLEGKRRMSAEELLRGMANE